MCFKILVTEKNDVVFNENLAFKNFGSCDMNKCKIVFDFQNVLIYRIANLWANGRND